jgi:hypothetical protein
MGLRMQLRGVLAVAALSFAALPAEAGEYLKPEQAKAMFAGKLYSYTCFEGPTGAGRIHADGSVIGTIRVRGSGPSRFVMLPKDTIRVRPDSICASVPGVPFSPCFNVELIDSHSFRGSISGLGFASCVFTRRGSNHMQVAEAPPLSLTRPGTPTFRPHRNRGSRTADAAPHAPAPPVDSDMKLRPSKD